VRAVPPVEELSHGHPQLDPPPVRRKPRTIRDYLPLKGMPLTDLTIDIRTGPDVAIPRSLTTLQKINFRPAADLWKETDGK
jgi:hypothetical protein